MRGLHTMDGSASSLFVFFSKSGKLLLQSHLLLFRASIRGSFPLMIIQFIWFRECVCENLSWQKDYLSVSSSSWSRLPPTRPVEWISKANTIKLISIWMPDSMIESKLFSQLSLVWRKEELIQSSHHHPCKSCNLNHGTRHSDDRTTHGYPDCHRDDGKW